MAAKKKLAVSLKVGDLVKIRHSVDLRGQIVELRGPLGPGGVQVYRIRVRRKSTGRPKPKPTYIELREDQLQAIPAGT
jgi:hypothetical protein